MATTTKPDKSDEAHLAPLQSNLLSGQAASHGFFTRKGGVSEGIYAGLNVGLGSSDIKENVIENRKRVAAWFGQNPEQLVGLYQIHSADVVTVDDPATHDRPKADAMVTATPGIILGILTADCGPVLFLDAENHVAGAAHAGWKGAFTGVLENTIEAMERLGANRKNIQAVLGPSISANNYEVGPEFIARFLEVDAANDAYFTPSKNAEHFMFNLPTYTVDRLKAAGVAASSLDLCTYADSEIFFSYRRTTHAKEPDYGRQISAIMLK